MIFATLRGKEWGKTRRKKRGMKEDRFVKWNMNDRRKWKGFISLYCHVTVWIWLTVEFEKAVRWAPSFCQQYQSKRSIVIVFSFQCCSTVPRAPGLPMQTYRQTLCSVSSHTALHTFVISNTTSIVFPDCIELRFTLERQMEMADNLAVCVSAEAVVHRC